MRQQPSTIFANYFLELYLNSQDNYQINHTKNTVWVLGHIMPRTKN